MTSLAKHVLAEYYGCDPAKLNDPTWLAPHLEQAVREAKATVIKSFLHQFSPQGVSGVVVLAESHLAVHTWPEHGYASVEIFTCGDNTEPELGHEYLLKQLKPVHHTLRVLMRGDMDLINKFPFQEMRDLPEQDLRQAGEARNE